MSTKTCASCFESKNLFQFRLARYRNRSYYRNKCRSCELIDKNRRIQNNPNYSSQRNAKSRQKYASDEAMRNARNAKRRADRANPSQRAKYILEDANRLDKKKGLFNDLTLSYVTSIINKPCHHCGDVELQRTLDRIDNTWGHLQHNIVVSCIRCNLIRRDMPWHAWECVARGVREARERGLFFDWTGQLHKIKVAKLDDSDQQQLLKEFAEIEKEFEIQTKLTNAIVDHLINCTEDGCKIHPNAGRA